MKHYRLKFLLIALLLAAAVSRGQDKGRNEPFFIIQITDPQFGMKDGDKDFSFETALLEKAVAAVNRLKPDFVVFTGDLVNTKGNRDQVSEFKRITSKIDSRIAVWVLPGNHDIGADPEQADIDAFIADYGHDRWSFAHKGSTFIGINSQLIKSGRTDAEAEQLKWITGALAGSDRSNQVIVFAHYPFFVKQADEPDTYSNIRVSKRNEYFDIFSRYGVDAVFAGHLHNNSQGTFKGVEMITTSAVGKPLGDAPSGLRIIKILPARTESVYYGLDEIPEIITFAAEKDKL